MGRKPEYRSGSRSLLRRSAAFPLGSCRDFSLGVLGNDFSLGHKSLEFPNPQLLRKVAQPPPRSKNTLLSCGRIARSGVFKGNKASDAFGIISMTNKVCVHIDQH